MFQRTSKMYKEMVEEISRLVSAEETLSKTNMVSTTFIHQSELQELCTLNKCGICLTKTNGPVFEEIGVTGEHIPISRG